MFILLICTCILTTQAIPCDNGYYGPSCQLKCSTECINNTCQQSHSGIEECTLGCKPGFYGTRCNIPCKAFENTCRKCPQECEGGFCQLGSSCARRCQDSYYGTACKSCPARCEGCNQITGDCYSCKPGWSGATCKNQCPIRCMADQCNMDGICTSGCRQGWYGPLCNTQCKRCLGEDCDKAYTNTCRKCPQECEGGFCQLGSSCVEGCQDSYYGTACKSCPAGCEVCNRVSGSCDVCLHCEGDCSQGCTEGCEVGYFGRFCEYSCSSHCASGCNQIRGDCYSCKSGWFGISCEKQCPVRCLDKECDTDGLCTSGCTQGWFGQRCESQCPEGCLDGYCDQVGICTQGCTHGLYGKNCDSRCGTGCANGTCDSRGTCSDGCRDIFYGEQCKDKCSAFCLHGTCDDKDGICKNCMKNHHGSRCEKSCERCINGSCSQDTGHCIQGCKSNYKGEFCQHDCSGNCTTDECLDACTTASKTDKPSGAEISHVIRYLVGGNVVLVVAALLMYAVCRFQRNRIKRRHRIHNDTTDEQQQPLSDITATYRDQQQHVYSQLDDFTASPPHLLGARSSAVVWSSQTSPSTESPENVENETPQSFHPSIGYSKSCRLESTDAADSQPGPSVEHSYLTAIAPTGAGGLLSRREINSGRKVEDDVAGSNKPADHDNELDENESFHDEGSCMVEDANPCTYVNFRGLYRS